jgi:ComF family protein
MNFSPILDLIFPNHCVGCGILLDHGAALCARCRDSIKIHHSLFCAVCHRPTLTDPPLCHPTARYSLGAASSYQDPLCERLVRSLKFDLISAAAEPLADLLIEYFSQAFPRVALHEPLVIPIPLHIKRERIRGFNQSALIAKSFAAHFGFEYAPNILIRSKFTRAQSTLGADARYENIASAFSLAKSPGNRTVILIDDVVTSGATFGEATAQFPNRVFALAALKA